MDGHEVKNWKSVYTTYFDKSLSLKQGRRVAAALCLEKPNIHLIQFACETLKLKSMVEPVKKHPRDFFNHGRLKVMLIDDKTGQECHPEIGTCKRRLLQKIAEVFPQA